MKRSIEEILEYIKDRLSEDPTSQEYIDRLVEKILNESGNFSQIA